MGSEKWRDCAHKRAQFRTAVWECIKRQWGDRKGHPLQYQWSDLHVAHDAAKECPWIDDVCADDAMFALIDLGEEHGVVLFEGINEYGEPVAAPWE